MIKRLILAILLMAWIPSEAQYLQMGNQLQRQIVGSDTTYRFNLGAPGFAYWKSLASYKSMFAPISGSANYIQNIPFNGTTQAASINIDGNLIAINNAKSSLFVSPMFSTAPTYDGQDGVFGVRVEHSTNDLLRISDGKILRKLNFFDNTQDNELSLKNTFTYAYNGSPRLSVSTSGTVNIPAQPATNNTSTVLARTASGDIVERNDIATTSQIPTNYVTTNTNQNTGLTGNKTWTGDAKFDGNLISGLGAINLFQTSNPGQTFSNYTRITGLTNGLTLLPHSNQTWQRNLMFPAINANYNYTFQAKSGTIAHLDDIVTPTLQQVTTAGNTTSNDINISSSIANLGLTSTQPGGKSFYLSVGYNDATSLSIRDGVNQRILINSIGNVGIVNTNPQSALDVIGSGRGSTNDGNANTWVRNQDLAAVSVTPQQVSGTSQTMAPNILYVPTNASLTTFSLPTTATFGQRFQVAGDGAGGYRISQNAGQQIVGVNGQTTSGTTGYVQSTNSNCVITILALSSTRFKITSQQGTFTVN